LGAAAGSKRRADAPPDPDGAGAGAPGPPPGRGAAAPGGAGAGAAAGAAAGAPLGPQSQGARQPPRALRPSALFNIQRLAGLVADRGSGRFRYERPPQLRSLVDPCCALIQPGRLSITVLKPKKAGLELELVGFTPLSLYRDEHGVKHLVGRFGD